MWLGMNLPRKNETFSLGASWVTSVIFPGFLGKSINIWINDGNGSLAGHHGIISLVFWVRPLLFTHSVWNTTNVVSFQWFYFLKSSSLYRFWGWKICSKKSFCYHCLWKPWLLPKLRNNMINNGGAPSFRLIFFFGRKISFFFFLREKKRLETKTLS